MVWRRILFSLCVFSLCVSAAPLRPNVLFIVVDDLRPELACYGAAHIVSPNIDRLASRGVLFQRAYCMVPVCGASRASLMTGLRPTRNRFLTYRTYAQVDAPGVTPLNSHFKAHGYYTVSNGKVFHHADDCVEGWSERPWRPRAQTYALQVNRRKARTNPNRRKRGPPFEAADVPDEYYADGKLARKAVQDLRRLAAGKQPFFLAVGFFKPHLPFVAPKKYWDLYDHNKIKLPSNYYVPKGAPRVALHNSGELRQYADVPKQGIIPEELARWLIHGYYACVSYTDAQIGLLLKEMDRLKLWDSTIVVLWGDHGWNLGEHTLWCKHCCFETSMRAPLIVAAPGIPGGKSTEALTEFIDVYPSLCELAGLPKPGHLQGKSFVPVLKKPTLTIKDCVRGRYLRGDTIKTARYRFTLYTDRKGAELGRMLYDHITDPGENVNVAGEPANAGIVEKLKSRLFR